MLCKVCTCMLRGGTGQQWIGTHDLTFKHHSRTDSLRRSRETGCAICIALANELRHEVDLLGEHDISIEASLSEVRDSHYANSIYRLDFELQKRRTRTFVLRQTDRQITWSRTPKSSHTSSDEVFELAYEWISKCKCADDLWNAEGQKPWYPKRLIDLEKLRKANALEEEGSLTFFSKHANLERTRVKLVEPNFEEMKMKENNRYVTLSHCWGKPKSVQGQLKLTANNEERFKSEGIELRDLSRTFRDAILFACRLENVGYIWIDSLCIKQQSADPREDSTEAERDWLEQSRVMDEIYRKSYLNISATAAVDGDQGLFFERRPEDLWEDEINLNVTDFMGRDLAPQIIPGPVEMITMPRSLSPEVDETHHTRITRKKRKGSDVNSNGSKRPRRTGTFFDGGGIAENQGTDCLKRCTIIDVSFWGELVDRAPVNRRAWVLQERIMAPRVLHFCHNQIAWECSEFQDAEGYPEGLPSLTMKNGDIVDEGRLKSLLGVDGNRLRSNRLKGFRDPDKDLDNLYIYELWKRMVEVYSKTTLTMSRDKLIALSGIARRFSQWTKCEYVAGMWSTYLESQLLWYVNEAFEDGSFVNESKRVSTRAPSFSWAALDTPNGIIYGEATDYGPDSADALFFRVKGHQLFYSDTSNRFGLIEEGKGFIDIKPKYLRKIELRKLQPPQRVPYSWRLLDGSPKQCAIEHFNLNLDAPETDVDVFQKHAELFCMPAAFGERTVKESSRYLICLLLKLEKKEGDRKSFKRFGLAKLSNCSDGDSIKELRKKHFNGEIRIW